MTKICPQCNQEFSTRYSDQVNCSKKCAYRSCSAKMKEKTTGVLRPRGDKTRNAVYDFLVDYKLANDGNSPVLREIADACDMSIRAIDAAVDALVKQDRIRRIGQGKAGNIVIVGGKWLPPVVNESNG
jgi:hypothetical protein